MPAGFIGASLRGEAMEIPIPGSMDDSSLDRVGRTKVDSLEFPFGAFLPPIVFGVVVFGAVSFVIARPGALALSIALASFCCASCCRFRTNMKPAKPKKPNAKIKKAAR